MVAFFNGKKRSRILLVSILILTLIATYSVPMSVFAAAPATGSASQIVSNGSSQSFDSGAVTISKTITGTAIENEFDITLKVVTKSKIETQTTSKVNVAIVMDVSGSMSGERLNNAKKAAKALVAEILRDSENKVGLVSFQQTATRVQELTNEKSQLNGSNDTGAGGGKIGNLSAGGGTNIQDGIRKAQDMLSGASGKKYIVLLSDGEPTYSYKGTATASNNGEIINYSGVTAPNFKITDFNYTSSLRGSGGDYSLYYYIPLWGWEDERYSIGSKTVSDNGVPTISQALMAKGSGIEVYSIGCDVGSNASAQFTLRNVASDANHYQSVSNNNLTTVFQRISQNILIKTQAWYVSDPMGSFIQLKDFVPSNGAVTSGGGIYWDLKSNAVTPVESDIVNGVPTKYTYTLNYKVKLNTDADGFVPETPYETNGTTTLAYTIGNEATELLQLRSANFVVPKVKGQLPSFNVTVKYYTVDNNNVRTYLNDKDYSLGLIQKGTTFVSAADSERNRYYNTGAILAENYYEGVIVNPTNTVSSTNNVIEVNYQAKLKMPYQVNYYNNSVSGTPIGTTTSAMNYVTGTSITTIGELETLYMQNGYRVKSVSLPLIISETASNNIINVVYEPIPKYEYRIEYYLGETRQDNETVTGSAIAGTSISNVTIKTFSHWNHSGTDYGSPGATSLVVTSNPAQNVIKVYYTAENKYLYTIEHIAVDRQGNETLLSAENGTSEYAGTMIGKSTIENKVLSDATIKTLGGYENKRFSHNGSIEFNDTALGESFTITSQQNVVKIYYQDAPIYGYTVNYFDDGVQVATVPAVAAEGYYDGAELGVDIIDVEQNKPAHHHVNAIMVGDTAAGSAFAVTKEGTVINVYYVEDQKFGYTVEYYIGGNIQAGLTYSSGTVYYEGDEITSVDQGNGKPSGYLVDRVNWNGEDGQGPLIISSNSDNVIRVYYEPATGIYYRVEHYFQNDDDSYPAAASEVKGEAGTTGAIVLADDFILDTSAESEYYGYRYVVTEDSVTSAAIDGNGITKLKLYYEQIKAPLTIKHIYDGTEDETKRVEQQVRIGKAVYAGQSRSYGYILDEIRENGSHWGGDSTPTSYEGSMSDDLETGLVVEFIYKKVDSAIVITRHYENKTTGTTGQAIEDMETTTAAINLIEESKRVFGGLTYKLVRATIESTFIENIRVELGDAIEEFTANLENVRALYNAMVDTLTDEEKADAKQTYDEAISPTAIRLADAETAFQAKDAELIQIRDNSVSSEKAAFEAAQAAYNNAVRTLTPEGITITAEEALTITYGGILEKYDDAIKAALDSIDSAKSSSEYAAAVEAIINSDLAVIAAQAEFDSAEAALDLAVAPGPDATPEEQAAYDALVSAVDDAREQLEAAKDAVDTSEATTTDLENAKAELESIEEYKTDFIDAEDSLAEKGSLASAESSYENAKSAAWDVYEESLKDTDEYKEKTEAQEAHNQALKNAQDAYDAAIRELVKEKDGGAQMVADLEAAEAALRDAQEDLQDAIERSQVKNFDPSKLDDIALLSAYLFDEDMDYVVDIYYEYEETNNGGTDDGGGKGGGGGGGTPIIKDDEIPAGPIEILDDETPAAPLEALDTEVPAGPLPKTGGLSSILLYGIGTMLAGGGIALRRKEKKSEK